MRAHSASLHTQPGSATGSSHWSDNRARTPEMERHIGRAFLILREEARVTQKQVAERLGVTFQAVQRYEKGRARISLSTALELCRALDVSILRLVAIVHQLSRSAEATADAPSPTPKGTSHD